MSFGLELEAPAPITTDTLLPFGNVKQPELGIRISKAFVDEAPETWPGGFRDPRLTPLRYWAFRIDTIHAGQQFYVAWTQHVDCKGEIYSADYAHALGILLGKILKALPA